MSNKLADFCHSKELDIQPSSLRLVHSNGTGPVLTKEELKRGKEVLAALRRGEFITWTQK